MRPRFFLWSDHGAPAQRQWKSSSKRGVSIGPKILLAAAVIVAGFIGISGIFPEVIDARWAPDVVARLPVMSLSAPDARTKASPPRRVTTTGQGTVLPRPAPTPDTARPERAKAEAVAAAPQAATPLGAAEVPESKTQADALPAEAAPAPAARAAEQTKSTRMAQRAKPVVKKVVHFAQRRSSHRDYAQYNAWGWPSSGWGGWGGGYRF
jgi:hypothetical protein